MLNFTDLNEGSNFKEDNIILNEDNPEIVYLALTSNNDNVVLTTFLDIDGDETTIAISPRALGDLISELNTAHQNLIQMNLNKY